MLAIKPQCSLKDARHYFQEHLTVGDYYTEGQHVPGHWFGHGAEQLGLSGVTRMDEFVRLCENLHPQTGQKLTLRQNTTRTDIGPDGQEQTNSNRRVFYDFTFSPAKSVSIAALEKELATLSGGSMRPQTRCPSEEETQNERRWTRPYQGCAEGTLGKNQNGKKDLALWAFEGRYETHTAKPN